MVAAATEADKERKRKLRASSRAERTEVAASMLLERVHDASGSVITANSMRLRTLPDGPAREVARGDVKHDIARYVHVPIETKASCVSDYVDATEIKEQSICAACGLRDPADRCDLAVDLTELVSDHWLEVGPEALERMRALTCRQWRFCAALRAKATRRSAYHSPPCTTCMRWM